MTAGDISGVTITGGTITGSTITGGTIQTAETGNRIVLDGSDNKLKFMFQYMEIVVLV
ncbi:MAG: hypothetical protein XE08_0699 [Parcubacteria bacterium 32_520]|nr:MAG: hypothetical protein XE08_0699 [Parcubacteria bacterium 32_520]